MPDYHLGRVHVPDVRDAAYPASLHLAMLPPAPPISKAWAGPSLRLDQGATSSCVGFAGEAWKGNAPIKDAISNADALSLYHACKAIDAISEEGTSDRYLAKVMVQQGRIERYLWATTPDQFLQWLSYVGPVMVGTAWYTDMFSPVLENVAGVARFMLHPRGNVEGGHEYLVRRLDIRHRMALIRNSWSDQWAQRGEAWIALDDLFRLLFQEDGDALCAVERRP